MNRHRATRRCGLLALLLSGLTLGVAAQGPRPAAAADPAPPGPAAGDIALIVHEECPLKDVKLAQVRGYLRLERQFWPDRKRVVLFLPPGDTRTKEILNERIYGMDEKRLRKYWVGKVFAGEIPAVPQVVRTPEAAGKVVAATLGAISAVPADEVPVGVRVLKIDGLAPGEKGYPLNGTLESGLRRSVDG